VGWVIGHHQVEEVFIRIVDDLMSQTRSAEVDFAGLEVDGLLVCAHEGRTGYGVLQLPQRPVGVEGKVSLARLQRHMLQVKGTSCILVGEVLTESATEATFR
jgi:hypothetical protein